MGRALPRRGFRRAFDALASASAQVTDTLASLTGVGGLALGYSAIFLVELGILLVILRRRWGGIDEGALISTTLRTIAATGVMSIAVVAADSVLGRLGWHDAGIVLSAARVLGLAVVGAGVFAVSALAFGVQELRALPRLVLRRRSAAPLEEAWI